MAVLLFHRRYYRLILLVTVGLVAAVYFYDQFYHYPTKGKPGWRLFGHGYRKSAFDWAGRVEKHPVSDSLLVHLPTAPPKPLRQIQHGFSQDKPDPGHAGEMARRRSSVYNAFRKSWESYRQYAWGYDELRPQTLRGSDTFSGWGATLVDSLDVIWIMGMKDDFEEAVQAVGNIDWDNSTSRDCSLFETNIRYLGGLLSAHELSGEPVLLNKALELGNMLYAGFDTPNRMPVNKFNYDRAKQGNLVPSDQEMLAHIGTLSLEFTKLTQLTGDDRFYDAIDRIKGNLIKTQDKTKLPGMWPTHIDLQNGFIISDNSFTLGAFADSMYEYLSKMYALLGGVDDSYERMHRKALDTAAKELLFRPMLPEKQDILFSGTVLSNGAIKDLQTEVQHLGCFAGGMYALGGKLFDIPEHVAIGEKIALGCAWAYSSMPTGIMPETSELLACDTPNLGPCEWNETRWQDARWSKTAKFPPGYTFIRDAHYLLRPEAIESIFILYRITGKRELQETAWTMFQAVRRATETTFAHSAIMDVNVEGGTQKTDSMESFWLAETLKYFYLIFSEPDVISLDDYVFNTEAHPFRISKPS